MQYEGILEENLSEFIIQKLDATIPYNEVNDICINLMEQEIVPSLLINEIEHHISNELVH